MAVRMRLRREGKRKQPFYRIVVADGRAPRDGRFIEDLGYYHPIREPSEIHIDHERALHWLRNGVQPSDAVVNLLRIAGIWEEFRPGEPDPHAARRRKRADKRAKHAERLEAARRAHDDARRREEEEKAAADAARVEEIAEQAAEEAPAQPAEEAPVEPVAEEAPAEPAAADTPAADEVKEGGS